MWAWVGLGRLQWGVVVGLVWGWRVNGWCVGGCGCLWVGERVGSVMAEVGV